VIGTGGEKERGGKKGMGGTTIGSLSTNKSKGEKELPRWGLGGPPIWKGRLGVHKREKRGKMEIKGHLNGMNTREVTTRDRLGREEGENVGQQKDKTQGGLRRMPRRKRRGD